MKDYKNIKYHISYIKNSHIIYIYIYYMIPRDGNET